MEPEIFSDEYRREMNVKADLIRKAEAIRKTNNLKYSKVIEKYKAQYQRLHRLPIRRLKIVVEELVT